MAVLEIIQFPDPRLRMPCEPVAAFDDDLKTLARDLADTMRAAPGIGITAAHVGVPLRVVVIQLATDGVTRVYANPLILWSSPAMARHPEGSVSMPGITEEVERPARIRFRFHDLEGAECEEEAAGLLAVCLQHEIDQLDGIYWLQRLSRLKRDRAIRRFAKARA